MAAKVGGLTVNLTATTGGFKKGMDSAKKSVTSLRAGMNTGIATVAKYGGAFGAAALGGMAIFVKANLESIDSTTKLASELGLSTEAMSAYELQAGLTGTSMQGVSGALQKMQKNLGDFAQKGVGPAADGLELMGLKFEDIQGLSVEDQFRKISDGVAGIEDPMLRASAASSIFGGKGIKDIMSFLQSGSAGFDKAAESARQFGTSISMIDGKKVEMANDAILLLQQVFKGITQQITIGLAPLITVIAQRFQNMGNVGASVGGIMDKVLSFIFKGVKQVIDIWNGLQIAVNLVKGVFIGVGQAILHVANAGVKAGQWIGNVFTALWETIKAGGSNLASTFELIWGAIRRGINAAVTFIQTSIGGLLESAAQSLRKVKGMSDIATDLEVAGARMRNAGLQSQNASIKAFNKTKEAVAEVGAESTRTAEKLGAAFSGKGVEDSAMLLAGVAELEKQKEEVKNAIVRDSNDIRNNQTFVADLEADMAKAKALAEQQATAASTKLEVTKTQQQIEHDALLTGQAKFNDDMLKNEKKARDANTMLWKSGLKGKLSIAKGVLGDVSNLMQSQSKSEFKVGKAAAISEAAVSGVLGAQKAFSSLAGIPIIGPALGIAAAGAALLSAKNNISNIKGTSFGGSATPSAPASSSISAGASSVAAPEAVSESTETAVQSAGELVINVPDGALVDGRMLVENVINPFLADGGTLNNIRIG
tara:strand:- start:6578 stop:8701 length:2124 start_codon:yes stop_codon:yes gene_type:complete